jgi:hypothetical protein
MNNDVFRPEWVPSAYRENVKKEMTNKDKNNFNLNTCKDILIGVAIGDALGVPVEFQSRQEISNQPVTDMIGYGTHNTAILSIGDMIITGRQITKFLILG